MPNIIRMEPSQILVVEDEPDIREATSEALETEGYRVIQAAHGHEALRVLRHVRPALILLDLMMPHMSGWELREILGRDPQLASIPVIVMSAVERGGLPKPFGIDELLQAVGRFAPPDAARAPRREHTVAGRGAAHEGTTSR
jgi:CheY-like chemotaxis protein